MFTVEELEKKVAQLASEVDQSAGRHNILLGHKMCIEALLAECKKSAAEKATVVEIAAVSESADVAVESV